jgi:N-acetylmuramic acid 6-phosphate etherase
MSAARKDGIANLSTEQRNPRSTALDTKSALEIARIINGEDAKVSAAVKRALPRVAEAIDAIATALSTGGRLIYVGAGTSGRIAALDASECPPTFNTDPDSIQFVMAGGPKALSIAAEYNEDSREQGAADMARTRPNRRDVVVALAASGRTPYTIAALHYAMVHGATTVAVVCNKGSELARAARIEIAVDVGAEVVSGSTRMKSATAQKMICNMLTTGAMARLGYVYGNQMINVHLKNEKLTERGINILMTAAGIGREEAQRALKAADHSVPIALIMLKRRVDARQARVLLDAAGRHVRRAIEGGD